MVGRQLRYHPALRVHRQARQQRHAPAGDGIFNLGAVEEDIRLPAELVALDAPLGHLPPDGLVHLALSLLHLRQCLRRPADNVERPVALQRRHRVEVVGKDVTAQPGSLEGDGPSSGECVAHPGDMPEPPDAQFADKVRK